MNLKAIYDKLLSRDVFTWIGHGVMGFALTAIFGVTFMLGAFVYREASDMLAWWADSRPAALTDDTYHNLGGIWKRPFGMKARDGFMDLWAPLAGGALALMLFG